MFTAKIALVRGVIHSLTELGSKVNVVVSISAKIGTPLTIKILDGVADIVYGEVITSSPELIPIADIAPCKADVAELKVKAYLTPNFFAKDFSNSFTFSPPRNLSPGLAEKPDKCPPKLL